MLNIKKKYKYAQGGLFADDNSYLTKRNQTNQQVTGAVGVVGAINPIIGAGLAAGQAIGNQTTDQYGIYKSRAGSVLDNSINPTTGIQNLKDFTANPTWDSALNQFSLGMFGESASQKKAKAAKAQQLKMQNDRQNQQWMQDSQAYLQNYASNGVEMAGYYAKYGGKMPGYLCNALAEGGEVAVSDTIPQTDSHGGMNPLASNVSKFEGDKHSASSGGIGFSANSDTFIFSDALRTGDGITYAKSAELIGKQKGKFEKKLQSATDEAAHNTATRMIQKLDIKLSNLFNEQEALKQNGKI